jgi:glucose/arabinose dehydrogenase
MRFDLQGRLWGVENGMDNLGAPPSRNDFGDIHEDNPAEEVNMFLESDAGKFYGYPYCWTEGPSTSGKLLSFPQGQGVGTQWATYLNTPQTDVWCRNESNVVRPKFSMPAHSAPLDILFYNGTSFPGLAGKAAFVARHGSWNRPAERSGRTVDILHLNEEGIPTSMEGLLWGPSSSFAVRPVALSVGACAAYTECLFVSDDTTNSIYAIAYAPEHSNQPPTPPPQVAPPVAIGQLASLFVCVSMRFNRAGSNNLAFYYNRELSTGVVLSYVLQYALSRSLALTCFFFLFFC